MDASGLGQRSVSKRGNDSLVPAAGEANGSNTQTFPAHPHTFSAEHTLVGVKNKNRTALIAGKVPFEFPKPLRLQFDSQVFGNVLEFTETVLGAVAAVQRMICEKKFGRGACQAECSLSFCSDDHPLSHGLGTSGYGFLLAVDLHKTEATSGQRLVPLPNSTQVWDVDAIVEGSPQDGLTFRNLDPLAVNG